jgi:hypothetical protein
VDDNGSTIIKYSDGSWYSYNNLTNKYIFKSADSIKELNFKSISDMDDATNKYINAKNVSTSSFLKNDFMTNGFEKHSDKIYTTDLKTDKQLESYSKQWLKDNYNLELSIPIYYSDDLESDDNGKFSYKYKSPIDIKINKELQGMDLIVEKNIVHELTHYALFLNNKEFDDDTENFKFVLPPFLTHSNYHNIGFLQSHLQCTL